MSRTRSDHSRHGEVKTAKLGHHTLPDGHIALNHGGVHELEFLVPRLRHGHPHPTAELREKIKHYIHHRYLHNLVLGLLVIDMILVVCTGMLESQVLTTTIGDCTNYMEECIQRDDGHASAGHGHRRLSFEDGYYFAGEVDAGWEKEAADWLSPRRLASATETAHDTHADDVSAECGKEQHFGNMEYHDLELALANVSIAILIFFLCEQVLLMFAEGCSYFAHPLYLLDLFVTLLSLILEVAITNGAALGGLVILGRVWRFARIGHGVHETIHKTDHMNAAHGEEGEHGEHGVNESLSNSHFADSPEHGVKNTRVRASDDDRFSGAAVEQDSPKVHTF
jgi:hypothetical protein